MCIRDRFEIDFKTLFLREALYFPDSLDDNNALLHSPSIYLSISIYAVSIFVWQGKGFFNTKEVTTTSRLCHIWF